jgi:hypothetical protein
VSSGKGLIGGAIFIYNLSSLKESLQSFYGDVLLVMFFKNCKNRE